MSSVTVTGATTNLPEDGNRKGEDVEPSRASPPMTTRPWCKGCTETFVRRNSWRWRESRALRQSAADMTRFATKVKVSTTEVEEILIEFEQWEKRATDPELSRVIAPTLSSVSNDGRRKVTLVETVIDEEKTKGIHIRQSVGDDIKWKQATCDGKELRLAIVLSKTRPNRKNRKLDSYQKRFIRSVNHRYGHERGEVSAETPAPYVRLNRIRAHYTERKTCSWGGARDKREYVMQPSKTDWPQLRQATDQSREPIKTIWRWQKTIG